MPFITKLLVHNEPVNAVPVSWAVVLPSALPSTSAEPIPFTLLRCLSYRLFVAVPLFFPQTEPPFSTVPVAILYSIVEFSSLSPTIPPTEFAVAPTTFAPLLLYLIIVRSAEPHIPPM